VNLFSGKVTAEQIKDAIEAAVARGADRKDLETQYHDMVKWYGGEDKLAAAWTRKNLMRAYETELYGRARLAGSGTTDDDRERLRQLIRQYPDLAREILGDP